MEGLDISVTAAHFNSPDRRAQARDWGIGTVRTDGAEGFPLLWKMSGA